MGQPVGSTAVGWSGSRLLWDGAPGRGPRGEPGAGAEAGPGKGVSHIAPEVRSVVVSAAAISRFERPRATGTGTSR